MKAYIIVGLGGMIGASLRYGVSMWIGETANYFPWDTWLVNIIGAFLLSFILFLPKTLKLVPPVVLTGITTGVLGAFTTFSTFIVDIVSLLSTRPLVALVYVVSSLLFGLLGSLLGYKLARLLPGEGAAS